MALKKIYDTPFERLCLEERPEFSDPESQKRLEHIYNRRGYLKEGEQFIMVEEIEGFQKTIYGRTTGIDGYEVCGVDYIKNDICIHIETDEPHEHWLNVEQSDINKARILGITLFNKKEFITYNQEILENIIWRMNGIIIDSLGYHTDKEYFVIESGNEIDRYVERKIINYIEENRAFLEGLISDENGKRYDDISINIVYICDIVDFEDNLRCNEHVGYKTVEIPNSNYYLVVWPVKLD